MTPSRTIPALLILAALLLAAGCVGQPGDGKPTTNETITVATSGEIVTTTPGNPVPVPHPCPDPQNGSYTVALGDPFTINGHTSGPGITMVKIWMFGKNTLEITNVSVSENGSFIYTLTGLKNHDWSPGTYRIIIQYPDNDTSFDINPYGGEDRQGVFDPEGYLLFSIRDIQDTKDDGPGPADILEREIMKPGIADTCTNATLIFEEPWIQINPVGNHTIGEKFTVNGTTNLAAGNEIIVTMAPVDYRQPANVRGDSVPPIIRVKEGFCRNNSWSFAVNSESFSPEEYQVSAMAVIQDADAVERFFMYG